LGCVVLQYRRAVDWVNRGKMRQLLLLAALVGGVLCMTVDYNKYYYSRQPDLFRLLRKYHLWPRNETLKFERPKQNLNVPSPFIFGGESVAIESYPYQLSLRLEGTHICGASVIAERWALSAAHCLDEALYPSAITFRGGTPHRLAGGYIFHAEYYLLHPKFDRRTLDYDVSVTHVRESFFIDPIRAVTLANTNTYYPIPSAAVVTGWGLADADGYEPLILQSLEIYLQQKQFCWTSTIEALTDRQICGGSGVYGKETCYGDSGGPLVMNGYQVGIVSWGSDNCAVNIPGIYTSLTNDEVRAFIKLNTNV
uniref:Peptidase S1 domain-containing protein n=1 Tax=Anopheles coluzzii TaxID=1518534 RepID=A0A8W7PMZ4_ANOCL